jgi:hypothetical protein
MLVLQIETEEFKNERSTPLKQEMNDSEVKSADISLSFPSSFRQ